MSYTYEREDYSLINDGEYEAIAEVVEIRTLPSGKEKLEIRFRIRSDVEQQFGNRIIFEDIWPEKDNPQFFSRKRVNSLLGACGATEGQNFDGINDVINFVRGSALIIKVGNRLNDYRNKSENYVVHYASSKAKPASLDSKTVSNIIDSSDLPF